MVACLRGESIIKAKDYWHREVYILEIVADPWANLERVAQVLGCSTNAHEYADPRRVD
jgi:hypothetical protein